MILRMTRRDALGPKPLGLTRLENYPQWNLIPSPVGDAYQGDFAPQRTMKAVPLLSPTATIKISCVPGSLLCSSSHLPRSQPQLEPPIEEATGNLTGFHVREQDPLCLNSDGSRFFLTVVDGMSLRTESLTGKRLVEDQI